MSAQPTAIDAAALIERLDVALGIFTGIISNRATTDEERRYATDAFNAVREAGKALAALPAADLLRRLEPVAEPFCYVLEVPDFMGDMNNAPEQGYTDFSPVPKPGYIALYAAPPEAAERIRQLEQQCDELQFLYDHLHKDYKHVCTVDDARIAALEASLQQAVAERADILKAIDGLREGNMQLDNEPLLFVKGYENAVADLRSLVAHIAPEPK